MNHSERVEKFYDQNSKSFLKFGDHISTKCIHQPIWKDPTYSKEQALHYPHGEIQKWIETLTLNVVGNIKIADFGSGVGASVKYLAPLNQDKAFYAITLSKTQHQIAEEWLKKYPNIHCINDNYLNAALPPLNVIFQIESYNHCSNREALITKIKNQLIPGGFWIIFDDFVQEKYINHKDVNQYRKGWLLNILDTFQDFETDCRSNNLKVVNNINLTSYLKLGRPRDKWIKAFSPIIKYAAKINQYARSWYGGMARQKCLKKKMISYQMVVLQKNS